MGKPCKKIIYTIIITCKCKQTKLNALSVTVVITFKALSVHRVQLLGS